LEAVGPRKLRRNPELSGSVNEAFSAFLFHHGEAFVELAGRPMHLLENSVDDELAGAVDVAPARTWPERLSFWLHPRETF
jgi:hypothetical protein